MTTLQDRDGPSPEEVRRARRVSGLTQTDAAALVHRPTGIRWSEWESGRKRMQMDTYELFLILTDQHPNLKTARRQDDEKR